MPNKKKSILILVKGSSGEIDWILPILSKMSKKYNIYTYFKSVKAYNSLKNNREIFLLWKKINKDYFIDSYYKKFFSKLIRKLLIIFFVNKNSSIIIFLNNKIHNIQDLKNFFLKNKNSFFKFIFSEHFYLNSWVDSVKVKKEKSLVVHYPHSPYISFLKTPRKAFFKLNGDILLLSGDQDLHRWTNYIEKKNIRSLGTPKYDKWWVKEILSISKLDVKKNFINKGKNFIVTIPYTPLIDTHREKEKIFKKQLSDLMSSLLEFSKVKIIFKVHPRSNGLMLKKYLEQYNYCKNRWVISRSHLCSLANISNLFLCTVGSATIFDAIALKVPAVQFWPAIPSLEKINVHWVRSKLTSKVKNKDDLKKLVSSILLKKNDKRWINQQNSFKSTYLIKQKNTENIIKTLDHEYDKIFN